jgi:hypothetical protein
VRRVVTRAWTAFRSGLGQAALDAFLAQYEDTVTQQLAAATFPSHVYAQIAKLSQQLLDQGTDDHQAREQLAALLRLNAPNPAASSGLMWQGDARTMARTQALQGTNAGTDAAMAAHLHATGQLVERMWLAVDDTRTREAHRAADRQRRPVGQPFDVGGYPASFPGDPALPPSLSVNCRCILREATP